jgi:DNA-binding PadR family transcriptional regulator
VNDDDLRADGGIVETPPAEAGRLGDLTAFQRDVLWTLSHRGPTYGLGIKRALQAYYGDEVNHGRLYPNLDQLVDASLLEKTARDRRTNEYALTQSAEHALEARRAWEREGGEES